MHLNKFRLILENNNNNINKKQSDKEKLPVEKRVENAFDFLKKDYLLVGKSHIRAWKGWLALGLAVGIASGIILVANQSGDVEGGKAYSPVMDLVPRVTPSFFGVHEGQNGDFRLIAFRGSNKTFQSTDLSVATITSDGYFTALDIGALPFAVTRIIGFADGVLANNFAYLLVSSYPQDITAVLGKKTVFYMPTTQMDIVARNNILLSQAMDIAYEIQRVATHIRYPVDNPLLMITVDSSVCGGNGNPLRFGEGCFLDATDNQTVQWDILFHEMGHNSTHHSWNDFGVLGVHAAVTMPVPLYQEANATLLGLYTMQQINAMPIVLNPPTRESIKKRYEKKITFLANRLTEYENKGSLFAEDGEKAGLTTDALDGGYLRLIGKSKYGWQTVVRFMRVFQSSAETDALVLSDGVTSQERATFHAAALQVATGLDVRAQFKQLNFPIDDVLFDKLLPVFQELVAR